MKKRRFRWVSRAYFFSLMIGLVPVFLTAGVGWGQEGKKELPILTLEQLIERATAESPEIGERRSDAEAAGSDLDQVKAAYFPQITSTAIVGPVNDAKEPVIQDNKIVDVSPARRISTLGYFGRFDLSATQPLYTFGKLSNRKEAAGRGLKIKELEIEKKRNDIGLRVTQLYYALVFARGGVKSIEEADVFFGDVKRRIRRLLDVGSSTVSENDLHMVEAFRADTARSEAEAQKGMRVAYSALKAMIRFPVQEDFSVAEADLGINEEPLKELETYTRAALSDRVEFRQIKEALEAQDFEVRAYQSDRLPSVFMAFEASFAGAPGRETLDTTYFVDEFNHGYAGVVAGLRWELDFGIQKAKVAKAMAEYRKLRYTKANAEMNIPIQVRNAYEEILEWKKSASIYREAALASRKWIISSMSDFDMGVGTADNMLRAVEKYSHNQGRYIEALYNYNISMAELKYAVGQTDR